MKNRIRIVEFPRCKMASSGYSRDENPFAEGGTLRRFDQWWSEEDKKRADKWFPRDFMMYDPDEKALTWFYALPDGAEWPVDFEVVDYEGGLYASAVAIDGDDEDGQAVYESLKEWVKVSGNFELDERPGHYNLWHVISPQKVSEVIGHNQLEIFVPIKIKQ